MKLRIGQAWMEQLAWGMVPVILAGLAACTATGATSQALATDTPTPSVEGQPSVIGPGNVTDLVLAVILREGGVLAWSQDGDMFALAQFPGRGAPGILLFAYAPGTLARVGTLPSETNTMVMAFSPDGKLLAAGGYDGVIQLWNVVSGQLDSSLRGHSGPVLDLAFRPDGQLLVSRDETTMRQWDVGSGNLIHEEDGIAQVFASLLDFSPDGRWMALGGLSADWESGRIELRDADAPDLALASIVDEAERPTGLDFSPDGEILATVGPCSSGSIGVKMWKVDEGGLVKVREFQADGARSVTFSPDGRLLAVGGSGTSGSDINLWLWDASNGQMLHSLPGWFEVENEPPAFSPDGRWLATPGPFTGLVYLYEVGGEAGSSARALSLQSPQLAGSDVVELEDRLGSLGYLNYEPVDGIFDDVTDAAVRSFQSANQLPVDGVVDRETTAQLAAVATTPPVGGTLEPTELVVPSGPAVSSQLPTEQDVEAVASVWDLYNLSDGLDLETPGSREFSIAVTSDKPMIWPFHWCASDQDTLLENLGAISVQFLMEGVLVPLEDLLEFERDSEEWSCHYWATMLTGWQTGMKTTLEVRYQLAQSVNDGVRIYPAGEYRFILLVNGASLP